MNNSDEINNILGLTSFALTGKSYPIVEQNPTGLDSTVSDTIFLYQETINGRTFWKASITFSFIGGHYYAGKTIDGTGAGHREEIEEKLSALHDLQFWVEKW